MKKTSVFRECGIIIQARMSSERFPGKMMSCIYKKTPLLDYVYRRVKVSSIEHILVATSDDKSDDRLYRYCVKTGIPVFRGSLYNVLKRYIQAAEHIGVKYIVRVCGDTPFVDISLLELLAKTLIRDHLDYVSVDKKTCASGFYSEAISLKALKKSAAMTKDKENVEHVTKYIIDNKDKFLTKFTEVDLNPRFMRDFRLTIDYPNDMYTARAIIEKLPDRFCFTSKELLAVVCNEKP